MVKVNASIRMDHLTKVNGGITNHMDWGMKNMKMVRPSEEHSRLDSSKGAESSSGKMGQHILES